VESEKGGEEEVKIDGFARRYQILAILDSQIIHCSRAIKVLNELL